MRGAHAVAAFPPPEGAASLYRGEVMHARLRPVGHRFVYRVFSLLIDLDRLSEAGRLSPLFSVNRRNLVSFLESDHGPTGDGTLRERIGGLLAPCGIAGGVRRVLLFCYPRILGYAFNPLSVYYAYDGAGRLVAVVYEVRNTFGERHSYVAKVEPEELSEAGLRQERDKRFHVSPFLAMDMRYRFRLRPPGDVLAIRILASDAQGPALSATFSGRRRDLTARALLGALLALSPMTLKVIGGIHWEAVKLWWKGLRFLPRPQAPAPVSYGDVSPESPAREKPRFMLDAAE